MAKKKQIVHAPTFGVNERGIIGGQVHPDLLGPQAPAKIRQLGRTREQTLLLSGVDIDAEPEEPQWDEEGRLVGDVREVAVWICELCFDGQLRLPPEIDQGLCLDYHSERFRKEHRCTFRALDPKTQSLELAFARVAQRHGRWRATVLRMPIQIHEQLQQLGVKPGPVVTWPRNR